MVAASAAVGTSLQVEFWFAGGGGRLPLVNAGPAIGQRLANGGLVGQKRGWYKIDYGVSSLADKTE